MKILGISAGRKNGNAEILLQEAIAAAEQTDGIESAIIRLRELDLRQCLGCESCTRSLTQGGKEMCIQHDDLLWLRDRLYECDALIQAVPTYCLKPCGTYITMVDRFSGFGPEFMLRIFERPKRIAASIGVGGSDWVQLTLPLMMQAPFLLNMQVVDCMQATWVSKPRHVLLREDLLMRARRLGTHVAAAMRMAPEDVRYRGDSADDPAACPYCHQKLLILEQGTKVRCAVCAIEGTLIVDGSRLRVTWSRDSVAKVRWEAIGLASHFADIKKSHAEYDERQAAVSDRTDHHSCFELPSRTGDMTDG